MHLEKKKIIKDKIREEKDKLADIKQNNNLEKANDMMGVLEDIKN